MIVTVLAGAAAVLAAAFVGIVAVPLALLAVAVSTVPDADPAAWLLLAAAAVAALLPRHGRRVAVLGLPGAVAAALAIAGGPVTVGRVAASVALGATAFLLATHEIGPEARLGPVGFVAVAAGAWLVLAPGTVPGIGDPALGAYQAGVIRAVPAGVAAVVVARLWRSRMG